MSKLIINVDSDGVVYDYHEIMTELCEVYLDRQLNHAPDMWSMYDAWGISRNEWFTLFERAIFEGNVFSEGNEVPGALTGLDMLIEDGHHVRIVTSKRLSGAAGPRKSAQAQIQTLDWYGKRNLCSDLDIVFTTGRLKVDYPADVVIDDKPDLRWMQQNAVNLLFSQPWNRHVNTDQGNLWRVNGWVDVMDRITLAWAKKFAMASDG